MLEQAKYEAMWSHPEYRVVAPGAWAVPTFLEAANPRLGETVRDLGCGTGRAGLGLQAAGLEVTQYDFAPNCRDAEVQLPFELHDLTKPVPGLPADYAYCCDVLEHIPTDDVLRVLTNVVRAGRKAFLQISCTEDHMGVLIGEPLHLTVKPYAWWQEQMEALDFKVIWSEDKEHTCSFLVTAYADATEFGPKTVLNVSHETVYENVRENLKQGYTEVRPYEKQDAPLLILAGGPSLNDYKDEIIERRKA